MTTLATATSRIAPKDKLVTPTQQKQNLRRLSISFMSDEVARMTMLAAAATHSPEDTVGLSGGPSNSSSAKSNKKKAKKKKASSSASHAAPAPPTQASLDQTAHEMRARQALVRRAIKKLRRAERLKVRDVLFQTLGAPPSSAVGAAARTAAGINAGQGKSGKIGRGEAVRAEVDDEALYEETDAADKSRFRLTQGVVSFGAAKKLRRVPAKATWYSQYQADFDYEHRIQKDGFDFIFEYKAHFGNTVKAFFPTVLIDGPTGARREAGLHLAFLSLDRTGFNYWETFSSENTKHQSYQWAPPETKRRVAFKRRQAEFIQSIAYLPNKGMYIGAGLDMMTHLYDRNLNYIAALPTGERVIRHIVYNPKLDEIIIAGSDGCKAWRLSREYSEGRSVFELTVVRSYSDQIDSESHWVTHIEFDCDAQRVILIEENRVACINCLNGELMSLLQNIHEAPVTGAVWYHRSQYFITCCSGGKVKVWAMHHDSDMRFGKHDYALLHVFTGHTKAVTAVQLHPMSGLAVSVSLDSTMRVLNLEALEEVYVLQTNVPLISMNITKVSDVWYCMGATTDGNIRVWSINDCLGFFGVCRAVCMAAYQSHEIVNGINQLNVVIVAGEDVRIFASTGRLISNLVPGQLDGTIKCCSYSIAHDLLFILQTNFKKNRTVANLSVFDSRKTPCELVCHIPDPGSQTENDFSTTFLIANFSALDIEDYKLQKTYKRTSVSSGSGVGLGNNNNDNNVNAPSSPDSPSMSPMSTSPSRDDGSPTKRSPTQFKSHSHQRPSAPAFRGEDDHPIVDQCLVLGTMVGSLVFLQPGSKPRVVATFKDAHDSCISLIRYVPASKTLISFGLNMESKTVMNVWNIPSLNLVLCLPLRSRPTAVAFSSTMPYCAMGFADGTLQLIELLGSNPVEIDNSQTLEQHTDEVMSISFCDDLKVYCSSSRDHSIKVWDLGNRLINRITLNKIPKICFFNGPSGDIVIAQGIYMLKVALTTWMPLGGADAAKKYVKMSEKNQSPTLKFVKGTGGRGSIIFIDSNGSEVGNFIGADGTLHRKKATGRTLQDRNAEMEVKDEALQAKIEALSEIMESALLTAGKNNISAPRGARNTEGSRRKTVFPGSAAAKTPPESSDDEEHGRVMRIPSKPTTPIGTRNRDNPNRNFRTHKAINENVSKYVFESISNMASIAKNIESMAPPLKNITKGLVDSLKLDLLVDGTKNIASSFRRGNDEEDSRPHTNVLDSRERGIAAAAEELEEGPRGDSAAAAAAAATTMPAGGKKGGQLG